MTQNRNERVYLSSTLGVNKTDLTKVEGSHHCFSNCSASNAWGPGSVQVLTQQVWVGTPNSAFLTSSQVPLKLLHMGKVLEYT